MQMYEDSCSKFPAAVTGANIQYNNGYGIIDHVVFFSTK
jgi:hypothetical protein